MTRRSLPLKLASVAAFTLAAVLAATLAEAQGLFSGGDPVASSAVEHRSLKFKIRGDLARQVAPGVSQPLNLRLTNPYRFGLKVKRLTVAVGVDRRHVAAGCRVSRNFKVTALAKRAYPIRLRPRRTRSLRAVGVRRLPRVEMRNLPISQDACKGAKLKFRYAGRARRWARSTGR